MRRFSPEEKEDQEFRKLLQRNSIEPDTIRHVCTKCRLGKPSMECTDCFALLCQGCVRYYGHDPKHRMTFHHPERLPHNRLPERSLNLPLDLDLAGLKTRDRDVTWRENYTEVFKESTDEDSSEKMQEFRDNLAINYKAVKLDSVAQALFENVTKVCHDCNFELCDTFQTGSHIPHHLLDPEDAAIEIKQILQKYATFGPKLVQRGEEAQHLCIVEKDKTLRAKENCINNINQAALECKRILSNFKSEYLTSLRISLNARNEELQLVDMTLFRQLQQENRYGRILDCILNLGGSNPAVAINMWRSYQNEIRKAEWKRKKKDNRSATHIKMLYFSQTQEFIDRIRDAVRNVSNVFGQALDEVNQAVHNHILRTAILPDKAKNLEFGEVGGNIESLRDVHMMQCLMGLPLGMDTTSGVPEIATYATDLGNMTKAEFFYMVDTFHTKWTKVLMAIHEDRWLAIYIPDQPQVLSNDVVTKGFRSGEFAKVVEENEKPLYKSPPECIITLAEVKVNTLTTGVENGSPLNDSSSNIKVLTPLARLLVEQMPLNGFEIVRVFKGMPLGWWIFIHPSNNTTNDWVEHIRRNSDLKSALPAAWPSRSTTYMPSTNPGTPTRSLGIRMPPIGRQWSAVHIREAPRDWETVEKTKSRGSTLHELLKTERNEDADSFKATFPS